ncbi:MAG: D-Ala-D-Ala carboxypeptidase family metallohydrolase [Candidatus Aminicenantes bacterium]|nr:D-Ala-D-Ala carboxypeptidase family metallohydrolase [Candidatus Aminicenantes bacterium]
MKFKDEISPYKILSVFVMPGEALAVEIVGQKDGSSYDLIHAAGESVRREAKKWVWTASEKKGLYPIKVVQTKTQETIFLNTIVMVPLALQQGEYLNGYRVGKYPSTPLRQLPIYRPPRGLIEVTKENQEMSLSPHFKLKQFLCKQDGPFPKYVLLRERLLIKLEIILEEVNKRGFRADTLFIFSGYRTPFYNRIIGNGSYSRHIYGGAVDIFIDSSPEDDLMDDLNRDGKIDLKDADVLYRIITELHKRPEFNKYIGGLAKYPRTKAHGPFVHTDVRGFNASW